MSGLLSCYTSSLLAYLSRHDPTAADRLADGVRLDVRTDLPDGPAFTQHERIDAGALSYLGSDDPDAALAGIGAELAGAGAAIVVANTAELPWSPAHRTSTAPHWVLLTEHSEGSWLLADPMDALLPSGRQEPFTGWVSDDDLATMTALPTELPAHLGRRDRYALGAGTEVPRRRHRWLVHDPGTDCTAAESGEWVRGTAAALRALAELLDGPSLQYSGEDLWAAARHHTFRLERLAGRGELPGGRAEQLAAAWADLPRALRFAADSARRGRPRPGLVRTALTRLADLTDTLS